MVKERRFVLLHPVPWVGVDFTLGPMEWAKTHKFCPPWAPRNARRIRPGSEGECDKDIRESEEDYAPMMKIKRIPRAR